MPRYEVELGDKRYEVDAPSIDDAYRALSRQPGGGKALPPSMQHETATPGERFKTGFMDPFVGVEQLARHSGLGGAEEFDRYVQERERDIRARGGGGFDPARAVGSAVSPLNLLPGGAAARTARPLIAGAVTGAMGGAMEPVAAGEDFLTEKATQAGEGAALGGVLGTAGKVARSAMRPTGSTVEDLERAARQGYDALKNSNTVVRGSDVQNVVSIIRDQLKANHFRDYLHPQTFAVMNEIVSHKGNVDIGDLKGWQELLKKVGGTPGDQEAARFAQDLFDRYLQNIPAAHVLSGDPQRDAAILREAQANWRAARRSDAVDMSLERAERQAARSGSGANKENTVRQRIDAILNSPTERKKFSPDEISTMEEIVKGTLPINAMRAIGKFAPTGVVSSLPTLLAAGGGTAAHDPVTGALTAGAVAAPTLAAKYGAEYATKRKARDLAERIRAKAPAYVPPPPPNVMLRYGANALPALAPAAGAAVEQPGDALAPYDASDALAR